MITERPSRDHADHVGDAERAHSRQLYFQKRRRGPEYSGGRVTSSHGCVGGLAGRQGLRSPSGDRRDDAEGSGNAERVPNNGLRKLAAALGRHWLASVQRLAGIRRSYPRRP
jgi:hypothetical protein